MAVNETLNNTLLEQFMSRFLGYGNFNARVWFIGMEEGGGNNFDQVFKRLNTWRSRGLRELEDVRDYHLAIGIDRFFKEPVKLQRTWAHLIRVYLSAKDQSTEPHDLKQYQKDHFGCENGDTALLELMPLPSPGTNRWFYNAWSNLPYLKNRETYLAELLPKRIVLLREKIQEHKPPMVIFYGTTYRDYYENVIGSPVRLDNDLGVFFHSDASTKYLIIKHPAARGVTNQYFINVGEFLKP